MRKQERRDLVAAFEELSSISKDAANYFRAGGGGLVTLMGIRAKLDSLCKVFGKLNRQIVWSEESTPPVEKEDCIATPHTNNVKPTVLYSGSDPEPSLLH